MRSWCRRSVNLRTEISLVFASGCSSGASVLAGLDRIDHRLSSGVVFDLDQLGGVLGEVAALGHHQRHRLAGDSARARPRATTDAPATSARPGTDRMSLRMSSPVMTAQTPSFSQGGGGIDRHDIGVRVRRADDVGLQRAGWHWEIIGIAAAARQQRRVFLANDARAETL